MRTRDTGKSFLSCFQIRIWARRTAIEQGQGHYALNVTGPVLDFFQLYYNISYPLSKSGESNWRESSIFHPLLRWDVFLAFCDYLPCPS